MNLPATLSPDMQNWILYVSMFVVIFAVVSESLRDFSMFDRGTSLIVSLCVTGLGLLGMNKVLIQPIMASYGTLGFVILIGLVVLLLSIWISMVVRNIRK